MVAFDHESVMVSETLAALVPRSGGIYADVTLGAGGHAQAVLHASRPAGRVLGLDRDPSALSAACARLEPYGNRAMLVHGEMAELPSVLESVDVERVDGLVADLGVSSPQLDDAQRGFSLQHDGPLDMRMDSTKGETALDLIARMTDDELADLIYQLSDERKSRRIARSVRDAYRAGTLRTTEDLRRAVWRATGPRRGRIDPATRTFQAIRMAVNDEVGQLEGLLTILPDVLVDGGVAVIISFHSAEDRRVKHAFRDDERLEPCSKRPLRPADAEVESNARARSAKLRAARRVRRDAPRSEAP